VLEIPAGRGYDEGESQRKGVGAMIKLGCGGTLVLLVAAAGAVAVYKPEWLPPGIGYRPLPVEISAREATIGASHVLILENVGEVTLKDVTIICSRKPVDTTMESDNERTTVEVTKEKTFTEEAWPPGRTIQIGWMEGWGLKKGDTVRVKTKGFRTKYFEF
jgi:hypothetical protein